MDNRLVYYRENQVQIPEICHGILPEKLESVNDYLEINRCIYSQLKSCQAEILCQEWVNSRGVIVRFTRKCLEVKAIDEQECLHSDMALTAFLLALLRSDLCLEEDENALHELLEDAMLHGVAKLRPELEKLYMEAHNSATNEEQKYLPLWLNELSRAAWQRLCLKDSGHGQNQANLGPDGVVPEGKYAFFCRS